ncbi:SAP domain [Teratosphaeria destructans]|uniref:SAP domain n=1 Tax=Teratosphaeria destructans TaxID=418781 RepID=A0A9W7W1G4_9PEZI|nr:SAP domain [Teratosphaeria destructans]
MADYSKKKNDELVTLLKERGLPHTGKKADMVQRLNDHDAKQTAPPTATKADDEEIDWDDDIAQTATTEASKEAVAAGGVGEVKNPVDVPNQEPAIDPAQDSSLTVAAEGEPETAQEDEKAPEKDFSAGITEATLDEEIEKRRARAKKFGLTEDDDQIKMLLRAKKFGVTEGSGALGLLNSALSQGRKGEKAGEKRSLDTALSEETGRRKKGKFRHGRGDRQGDGKPAGGAPKQNGAAVEKKQGGAWMSEADRAKAEARKARFATAT